MAALPSLLVLPVVLVLAQDVASGPRPGDKPPALKVFDATGPRQGETVDYAAVRAGKPTAYLFVRADKWDRPMARFLKQLDEAAAKEGEDTFVVAVWLTDDVDKAKDYLPVAQQSLKLGHTALACFLGGAAGPEGWGLNPDAHLTAVVAAGGKVVKTFGYRSVNETDVPAVRDALRGAKKPE
jgi:hypothetical protein